MTDPDIDHGLWDDDNGFLDYNSPFLEIGFDEGESVMNMLIELCNQLLPTPNFVWAFINWQYMLYPHVLMHENFIELQNLALPLHTESRDELERVLRFLLPTPNGESDQEPPIANQGSSGKGMYIFTIACFIFIHLF